MISPTWKDWVWSHPLGGGLQIGMFNLGNAALISLSGLENLTSIGGSLSVLNNEALISLMGLEGLSSIEGDISIRGNIALTSLDGLDNLTSIAGDLIIGEGDYWTFYGNPSLSNLAALNNLTFIGGDATISENDVLTSLDGMESLTSIGGELRIGGYDFWNDVGHGNDALTSLDGLVNLTSVGGYLDISGNSSLTSLEGLGNLASIGGFFQVAYSALTSLDGLGSLNSIGGDLSIYHNNVLNSLNGLQNIESGSIENLSIASNEVLSTCEIECICEYLASPNGNIWIHSNAPGCNNPEEVQEACDTIQGVEETHKMPEFEIYPSPVNDFATLQFQLDQACIGVIEIFNATGVRIQRRQLKFNNAGQQHFVLDFTGLPAGMYFCKVQIGNRIVAKKIIKQ
jgi:hypothetical protein